MFFVYLHRNTKTGKVYIGYTGKTVESRFQNHCTYAKSGSKFLFHKAIRKYGVDIWDSEILIAVDTKEEAKEFEIKFISEHQSNHRKFGYNLTAGGEGNSNIGKKLTPEHREKVVAVLRANPPNKDSIALRAEKQRGVKRTEKQKLAISEGIRKAKSKGLTEAQIQQLKRLHERNRGSKRREQHYE